MNEQTASTLEEREREEKLRESASNGDIDHIHQLILQGVNVNSQNIMNGWTALHWAAKRGHVPVVKYLLDSGADRELKDSNAQLPADVTNSPDVISLLGGDPSSLEPKPKHSSPITPNYLANPVFPYANQYQNRTQESPMVTPRDMPVMSRTAGATRQEQHQGDGINSSDATEIVLKIRVADSHERDFYEAELSRARMTYDQLMTVMCSELQVDRHIVAKIRKLPDTVIRKDKDVQRLKDFQELELVLARHVRSKYNPAVSPRDEDIVY